MIKNKLLKLIITFALINVTLCSIAQNNIGLTKQQVEDLQTKSSELVKNYYSYLNNMFGLISNSPKDAEAFNSFALECFENNETPVFNDLISGGSQYMEVRRYLNSISTVFGKYPGEINIQNEVKASDIFYHSKNNHYTIKITYQVELSGRNNDKKYISKINMLIAYVKIPIANDEYETPQIYWIMKENEADDAGLKMVDIVSKEMMVINQQKNAEYEEQINESKSKINKLQSKLSEYINKEKEIISREKSVERAEAKIASQQLVIEDQKSSIIKKQSEIENQKRDLQLKEKQITEQKEELNQKENEIKKKQSKIISQNNTLKNYEKSLNIKKGNMYNYRRILSIGLGTNQYLGTIENIFNNNINNTRSFNPQMRVMIGYRYDFQKNRTGTNINRGNIFALFGTYTFNRPSTISQLIETNNLNIDANRQEPEYNRSLDFEAGWIFREFFRISGGIGGLNGYKYNIGTLSFHIPVTHYGTIELGTNFLFERDFTSPQMFPFFNLALNFNDNNPQKDIIVKGKTHIVTEWGFSTTYNFITTYDETEYLDYLNYKTHLFMGINLSRDYNPNYYLGFWGNLGNFNKNFTQKLLSLYPNNLESISYDNNFNPYFHLDIGTYLNKNQGFKISYGYGYFFPSNNTKMPLHNLTIGSSFNIADDLVRLNLELSDKILNNDFTIHIPSISAGLSMRFNWLRTQ